MGIVAVRIARAALEEALGRSGPAADVLPGPRLEGTFNEPRGVFVTLHRYPEEELRGCIGFPLPVYPLREALGRAAVAAAFEDPRFAPVDRGELDRIVVEVSLLTTPAPLPTGPPDARARAVRVGRHGLVVRRGRRSGLLLPQVAQEYGWSAEEFLGQTCEKAGLPPHAWRDPATVVEAFEAGVFGEESPNGPIRPRSPPSGG